MQQTLSPQPNLLTHNTSNIQVIRRDGSTTLLNIAKIRSVVEWACEGKEVNPITLEAGLTTRLKNGVTTREIQDNLIDCALGMCSPSEPEWRYVAGRLHIWNLWKDVIVSRGYGYGDYAKTVRLQVEANQYDRQILTYSTEELSLAGTWINQEWDKDYDYAGAVLLTKRYLLPDELPQEAFLTCALLLASVEAPQQRLIVAQQFYEAIARRKISLATPILANLRIPNGSLSSCFITAIDDNLESIFGEITNTARISKNGGGVGVNVSRIRSTGSWVMGKKNASGGVVPWIKLLNDTAIAVNQGGRRAGAVTVGVDIWHLDVPEFLEMQTENGDQRRKAYDVFPQLVITDEFMRRVVAKQEWTLVDPYEVRTKLGIELATLWGEQFETAYRQIESELDQTITLYKKINARELFKEIMRSQVETGMPYLAFKDTINRANPNQHEGYIPGVNLCCESFSNVKPGVESHCCNLVSINLANTEETELPNICQLAVRILDNTIDLTNPPFAASKNHNDKYRTIGVGCMGLADWLAKRRLTYDHLSEISYLFEEFGYWCTHASMELAKERGAYSAFAGSEWSKGKLIGAKPLEWFLENARDQERWVNLSQDIQTHGIRNSHISAIAPNTSSSLVQGCTASVLPAYSKFFYDKWAKGAVPIAPPFLQDFFWFYPENKSLDQRKVVKAVATMQKWIDTGISMELLFNLNQGVYFPNEPERCLKAKDIYETLILAWESGCKAVYYIRTVQKDDFKESNDTCVACAN
ncbi:ribonucleoside-diphosphate reductase, alpha subunit [Stanieria cyanosphaera PCC 7437]|uniref:Ribonucleoside-diphosphate reductase n=1 Tax=Stanieria cyanosphaera (strain ATCC 29371 / PCC 7437) TaxID=111780 RepID=K9XXK6_STAC7|nr:ribonucleoside-diphosphate reductase subunit alpha [Stanieria cyanosphaera]AFZ36836.1 ribonucleoside-diphosphate reductase, alpha subunit [Stanieria cyanosphaera PCC 7437]